MLLVELCEHEKIFCASGTPTLCSGFLNSGSTTFDVAASNATGGELLGAVAQVNPLDILEVFAAFESLLRHTMARMSDCKTRKGEERSNELEDVHFVEGEKVKDG